MEVRRRMLVWIRPSGGAGLIGHASHPAEGAGPVALALLSSRRYESRIGAEGVCVHVIFYNGTFFARPDAEVLVVEGDRIAAIGPEEALAGASLEGKERVDLRGRILLPAFIDAHVHILGAGLTESGWRVDLSGLTREEACAALAGAVESRGSREWVLGGGWDEARWRDSRYLCREELDRFSPKSPVGAVRMDGHLMILNSEGLRAAREVLRSGPYEGLVDVLTGEVREEAAWKVIESLEPDDATLREALTAAARLCHRQGIASVHGMTPRSRVPVLLSSARREGLRVTAFHKVASAEEIGEVRESEEFDGTWVRFGGVKAFADGSLGAGNAAVGDPYVDGGTGRLNHTSAGLEAILRRSEEAGWRTAIHAIGDRAIEEVLQAHERVGSSRALRHRLEHFELPNDGQIERAVELGLHLSMQPNFVGNWSGPGSMYERKLGGARDEASNPFRLVLDAGAPLAFGSDGMPVSPIYGLHWAVNGAHPAQRVTADEAILAYTSGGALFAFEEDVKGRLEVGALADLVVLDADPRETPSRISERKVEATYVGGMRVFATEEA
jgi:predicted amidohydrolase YtcJ